MKKIEKLKIMKIERLKINLKNENFWRIVDDDGVIVFRMCQKVTGRKWDLVSRSYYERLPPQP